MRFLSLAVTAVLLLPSGLVAQNNLRRDQSGQQRINENDIEAKREFLQKLFARQLKDPRQIHEALSRLEQATPQEIETLMAAYEKKVSNSQQQKTQQQKLQEAKRELARAEARKQYLIQQFQQRRLGNPGFAPVITTLPSGFTFPVGAVISPDRRYVRISTSPIFSSVGPVRTFNFSNGHSGYSPGYGPQQHGPPALGEVYHDGLRTRIRPRRPASPSPSSYPRQYRSR